MLLLVGPFSVFFRLDTAVFYFYFQLALRQTEPTTTPCPIFLLSFLTIKLTSSFSKGSCTCPFNFCWIFISYQIGMSPSCSTTFLFSFRISSSFSWCSFFSLFASGLRGMLARSSHLLRISSIFQAEGLWVGLVVSRFRIKSFIFQEILQMDSSGNLKTPPEIPTAPESTKGCTKQHIVYRVHPNIHKSTFSLTLYFKQGSTISGGLYMGVVQEQIAYFAFSYQLLGITPKSTTSEVQEPKSQTFSFLSLATRMFSILMSRWAMPAL